jgi:hypothetical protein
MWQIGGFLLEVCVILFYIDCAYPLNPYKNLHCPITSYNRLGSTTKLKQQISIHWSFSNVNNSLIKRCIKN